MHIRAFCAEDASFLARIFYDSIHIGAAGAYDPEARRAWCPKVPEGSAWAKRLGGAITFVAENLGQPVGFMSLLPEGGHIDLAFVDPAHTRQGIASALCRRVETQAKALGLDRLTTDASLQAEPMFASQGWSVVKRQKIERRGVILRNCRMEKIGIQVAQ